MTNPYPQQEAPAPTYPQQQFETTPWGTYEVSSKSKIAAGVFGILLGVFGVHNFYLGYYGKAWAQLLITIISFGIFSWVSAIWGLIEGILILTATLPSQYCFDGDNRYLKN